MLKIQQRMQLAKKYFFLISGKSQQIFQNVFRITASGDNRITADGETRITADSDY